jgi:hypothetical protein
MEDDFEDKDVNKLAKGRSKRKKVGHVDLAWAREIVKQSEEALQLLKEREEAVEKAAREAQQRAARRVAKKAAREASEKGRRDSRHTAAHSRIEQFDKIPDTLFRDPQERKPKSLFRDPPPQCPTRPFA